MEQLVPKLTNLLFGNIDSWKLEFMPKPDTNDEINGKFCYSKKLNMATRNDVVCIISLGSGMSEMMSIPFNMIYKLHLSIHESYKD